MKVLSAEQTRQADSYTIKTEPIASIDLMERASIAFCNHFCELYENDKSITVVCGSGNNGGDGLAISRILHEKGYNITTYVARVSDGGSPDFTSNLSRLRKIKEPVKISSLENIPAFNDQDVIIDAIFGSGLDRPVTGFIGEIILAINDAKVQTVAVDIASGLNCDQPSEGKSIIEPAVTISFQAPKMAFFIPSNYKYVGDWIAVDIGLDKSFINSLATKQHVLDHNTISNLLPPRNKFDHKGTFGHGLLVGGSFGKIGAMVLAAGAFIRTGAGLLTVHIPKCGYNIIQTTVPEAMATADQSDNIISESKLEDRYATVGIGPGLGTDPETSKALKTILLSNKYPIVLDADGLNLVSKHGEILELLPEHSILTPHVKEFDRLAGTSNSDWERLEKIKSFAISHKVILVLKGAHTAIANPDGQVFYNNTGNPGMATGGSGDVLTGILASLLTQGYNPRDAANLGVYVHGLAGDLAALDLGEISLTATDIINYLPEAFLSLKG